MSVPVSLGKQVVTSTLNWRAMVVEAWGEEYRQRDIAYRFIDGTEKQSTDTTNRGFYSGR
jgi:hypothetical protein